MKLLAGQIGYDPVLISFFQAIIIGLSPIIYKGITLYGSKEIVISKHFLNTLSI